MHVQSGLNVSYSINPEPEKPSRLASRQKTPIYKAMEAKEYALLREKLFTSFWICDGKYKSLGELTTTAKKEKKFQKFFQTTLDDYIIILFSEKNTEQQKKITCCFCRQVLPLLSRFTVTLCSARITNIHLGIVSEQWIVETNQSIQRLMVVLFQTMKELQEILNSGSGEGRPVLNEHLVRCSVEFASIDHLQAQVQKMLQMRKRLLTEMEEWGSLSQQNSPLSTRKLRFGLVTVEKEDPKGMPKNKREPENAMPGLQKSTPRQFKKWPLQTSKIGPSYREMIICFKHALTEPWELLEGQYRMIHHIFCDLLKTEIEIYRAEFKTEVIPIATTVNDSIEKIKKTFDRQVTELITIQPQDDPVVLPKSKVVLKIDPEMQRGMIYKINEGFERLMYYKGNNWLIKKILGVLGEYWQYETFMSGASVSEQLKETDLEYYAFSDIDPIIVKAKYLGQIKSIKTSEELLELMIKLKNLSDIYIGYLRQEVDRVKKNAFCTEFILAIMPCFEAIFDFNRQAAFELGLTDSIDLSKLKMCVEVFNLILYILAQSNYDSIDKTIFSMPLRPIEQQPINLYKRVINFYIEVLDLQNFYATIYQEETKRIKKANLYDQYSYD
jgi:hypothetical protein